MNKFKAIILGAVFTLTSFASHKNIVDIASEAGNFKTLLTALEVAGLDSVLRDGNNFTVFAPTDEAFAKIPAETLQAILADQELLTSILLYHVAKPSLSGKVVSKLNGIKTLSGKFITNFSKDGEVILNQSKVIATDIRGENGVIHVIDTVLVPDANTANNEIQPVSFVDLKKYSGLWYEAYRLPNNFERGCNNITAEYTLKRNGTVRVVNTCVRDNGKVRKGKATAFVVNSETNSELKVSFVPFFQRWGWFAGDYNIIGLDKNYQWAIVGSKDRSFLWFLSRTVELDDATLAMLRMLATSQGYNVNKMIKTNRI